MGLADPGPLVRARGASDQLAACWYAVRGSNDVYWRVQTPAKVVGAKVCFIPIESGTRILSEPNLDSEFRWYATDEGAGYPDHQGVAVFTRPDQVRAAHAMAMKLYADAPRIVAEVDDNYTARNLTSVVADTGYQRLMLTRADHARAREEHLKALLAFDAIIVSTQWLRDTYARVFRKEFRQRPEIHVCGNHVDPEDWPERVESSTGALRVGWMGSSSHASDLGLAYPALRWAHDAGHEVVVVGHDPHWQPEDELAGRYASQARAPGYSFRYTHVPWQDPRTFERKDARWPLDIAVAPLQRTQVALGRSDSKALEYTMAGAACVLANQEPYAEWVHGETCLKANSPEDFWRAVQRLARDDTLRERLVANGQQYIREHRLIEHHADDWKAAVYG